jgi:hypothetical protein
VAPAGRVGMAATYPASQHLPQNSAIGAGLDLDSPTAIPHGAPQIACPVPRLVETRRRQSYAR